MEKEEKIKLNVVLVSIVLVIFLAVLVLAAPSFHTFGPGNITTGLEDTLLSYNFTANVTYTAGTNLTFSFVADGFTSNEHSSTDPNDYYWITLNSTSGVLEINATQNNETANFTMSILVVDDAEDGQARTFHFNISAVNDAPVWTNLINQSFNMSSLFNYTIIVTDEENDVPFTYNITPVSCDTAEWSYRNSTDCFLFNESQYTTNETTGVINITFTPGRDDVGDYRINFTVTDLNNSITPYNATTSQVVNFTVLVVNTVPYFRYICEAEGERNATEDTEFSCYINASDIDEITNITFEANETWFTFNGTATSTIQIPTNLTTSYNASALVNFTASDAQVGNWSINITITDTGSPTGLNSTTFYFFVDNINDSVSLDYLGNITAYTSNNYTRYVNASDDDLLILNDNVYNESLNPTTNSSAITTLGVEDSGTNRTQINISFNPNDLGVGNHLINITVRDSNNWSIDSKILNITVLANTAPAWVDPLQNNFTVDEDIPFYLNLSENVTDTDTLNFTNSTAFPNFFINLTTGVINFTANDSDVGSYYINITVTDGITPTTKQFNFTIDNINDVPNITSMEANGATPSPFTNATPVSTDEDLATQFFVIISDDDFYITDTEESITLTWSIVGPNITLFTFSETSGYPLEGEMRFETATFNPVKNDTGFYNITVNATDTSSSLSMFSFTLNITEVQHPPNMTEIGNTNTSIEEDLYFDINTTDEEDIDEQYPISNSTNLTYSITNLTALAGLLLESYPINTTTGVLNFTFNQTFAGILQFNLSVNDSEGNSDSEVFNISVYDYPYILTPDSTIEFNFKENVTFQLNFTANHTVQDNLNYTLYIGGTIKNSTYGNSDGDPFYWNHTAGFSDQTTCSGIINLTLNVSNPKFSNQTTWNVTVNNTNQPLSFSTNINDKSGGSPITISLVNHFSDSDASDECLNQTIGFIPTLLNGGPITVVVTNWTDGGNPQIEFSAPSNRHANYTITAFEYTNSSYDSAILRNTTSNNFSVDLEITSTTPSTGGGGASRKKPISLKILVPEPVSALKKDRLIIPLGVWNNGEINLNEIILDGTVAKDGLLRSDLIASFDRSFIQALPRGARENVTLIVDIDTQATGLFEVTINGTVRRPKYNDWAKFFIEIEEEEDILERILFTEEFIVGNPECTELKETVDEARELFAQGRPQEASLKAKEALEACQRAIAQPPTRRVLGKIGGQIVNYLVLASLLSFAIGLAYYFYKRVRLKRALRGY